MPTHFGELHLPKKYSSEMLMDVKGKMGFALYSLTLYMKNPSFCNGYKWENGFCFTEYFSL